jgi:uncharacterized caspase-like protein
MARVLAFLLLLAIAAGTQAGSRRALLIGINDYSASRLGAPRTAAPDRDWADLNGAVNDAEGMREMLQLLYEFEPQDIITLTDQEATREAILSALQNHLVKPAAKGDVLLFYYAGHGSRVRNSLSEEADRMDESLVPADSRAGARDIRDKELRPLFNAALDKGARLTVILDNCYSGSGARGLPIGARQRSIEADARDVADPAKSGPRPENRGALVLSATQDFDRADETRDEQRKFHGVFSLALLRAMRDASPDESASETFLRARARMRGDTPFQEPVMAGNDEARLTPLLGTRRRGRGDRAVVAVEKVQSDGTVVLQGGWANGLAVGSELRIPGDGECVIPSEVEGSASGARDPRCVRGIPQPSSRLGMTQVRLRVTTLIGLGRSEARLEPGHALPAAVKPGAMLEVVAWAAPSGRPLRVWTPRAAMLEGIDGIEVTERAEEADYVLTSRSAKGRLEHAWVRPSMSDADRRKSALPPRTDWSSDKSVLREAALRLRRIHAWNSLESPPGERSPYRLTLRNASTGEPASDVVIGGEQYELVLQTLAPANLRPRYVYIFVIDSHGRSVLLFPRSGSVENRLPLSVSASNDIRLGSDGSFEVAPPYGVDTFVLLTSDEALPNPWILEWSGVRSRGPGQGSLLPAAAAWTIERVLFESVPPRNISRAGR